jgi:hypothetical protein
MFYFSYYWYFKYLKFSEIVLLLFLMMTTLIMVPWNVWGEDIYTYTDKDGTILITNIPQDLPPGVKIYRHTDEDGTMVIATIPPRENIQPNTRSSNSYQDSVSDERLHLGRDNALIDEQKGKNGQRKKVKDGSGMDAGMYDVNIKKIANNLYQDINTHIIIKTRACVELAGRDGSLLDWSGISGELFFKNANKSCIVKKVYK